MDLAKTVPFPKRLGKPEEYARSVRVHVCMQVYVWMRMCVCAIYSNICVHVHAYLVCVYPWLFVLLVCVYVRYEVGCLCVTVSI